jgi:capsule polysaccharide export protein KpsE/RkpR
METDQVKSINVIDVLIVLAQKKKAIILTTFIVSLLTVVYVLVVPQHWVSRAAIKPVTDSNQGFDLSGALAGLGSTLLGGAMTSSSADFVAVMNSRTFSEDVIRHFDLPTVFKLEDPDSLRVMESSVRLLQEQVMRYSVSPETGNIYISAETKDRYLSKEIVDYYIKKIEKYNRTMQKSKGRQKRIFLEKRVTEVENEIERVKTAMQAYQEENKILEIEGQIRGAIEMYSTLIEKKIEFELQLIANREMYAENSLQIKTIQAGLNEIEKKISEVEHGAGVEYILGFDTIPQVANTFSGLFMQIEIYTKLYEFLYPQLEAARLEEIKDLPTLEIIDTGSIAGYRSKPKRARFCVIMFVLALISSSTVIAVSHYTPDSQKAKISQFWKILFSKK